MKKPLAVVVVAFIIAPCLAHAADVFVQAESFVLSNNLAPLEIRSYLGMIQGLDYPGEWAQYELLPSGFGTYRVTMRCWGTLNVPYNLYLNTLPVQGEASQRIKLYFVGAGQCGS